MSSVVPDPTPAEAAAAAALFAERPLTDACGGCGGKGWNLHAGSLLDTSGNRGPSIRAQCAVCGGTGKASR